MCLHRPCPRLTAGRLARRRFPAADRWGQFAGRQWRRSQNSGQNGEQDVGKLQVIVGVPAGRRTKWAVLVFWLIIVAVAGLASGQGRIDQGP